MKIRGEAKRGKAMVKQNSSNRKVRCWDCDGQFVWFRRKLANPATLQRLQTQLAKGELKHITTSDDVEVYEVQEHSPFKRKEENLPAVDLPTLTRNIVIAACKRDWATHVDGLQELATRLKNATYSDGKPAEEPFMKLIYQQHVTQIMQRILMRGGPSQGEMNREIGALRERRGEHRSRTSILMPE